MKKNNVILIAVIVLNSIVMIALAITFYLTNIKESKKSRIDNVLDSIETTNEQEKVGLEQEDVANLPIYELDAFTVNLADMKTTRYARITIKLELNNFEVEEEIERRTPQIRDLIIVLLSSKKFNDLQTTEGKDDLRDNIIKSINTYLVKGEIVNLYFTDFVVN